MLVGAHSMHREKADFFDPEVFSMLHLMDPVDLPLFWEAQRLRNHILDRLKDPRPGGCASGGIGEPHSMPPVEQLTLTPTQYDILIKWRDGLFDPDWDAAWDPPVDPPLTSDFEPEFPLSVADQPAALDRAALEGAVGGPLTPGIDVGPLMANESTYYFPFHISDSVINPGDITQALSVPWQAGFNYQTGLYPGARPVYVIVTNGPDYDIDLWTRPYTKPVPITKPPYTPDATDMDSKIDYDTIYQNQRMGNNQLMVDHWMRLGFLARDLNASELMYIETERR